MTVAELIVRLKQMPQDAVVLAHDECWLTDVEHATESLAVHVDDPAGAFWRVIPASRTKRFTKNPPRPVVVLT